MKPSGVAALAWTLAAALVTAAPQDQSGTGIVAGVVVDATTGRGVGRVAVRAVGRNVKQTRLTDDRGRFYFKSLASGDLTITAHKAGYIDGAYGKARAAGDGLPLTIEKAALPSFVRIDLFRAATISGQVADESGDPLVGVAVRAVRRAFVDGVWRQFETYGDVTDDHGDFRLFDLMPGEYIVMVPATQVTVPASLLDEIDATGTVTAEMQKVFAIPGTLSAMDVVGGSVRVGGEMPTPPPPANGRISAYRTQYYPGGDRLRVAMPVILGTGEHRAGVYFQMLPFTTTRVSGTVLGPDGPVGNQMLRLINVDDQDADMGNDVAVALNAADGRFTFLNVPSGHYAIEANGRVIALATVPVLVERPAEVTHTWGRTTVTVGDDEIDDVEIIVRPAPAVTGRVVSDPESTKRADEGPVGSVSFFWAHGVRPSHAAAVDETGRFRADGLAPGTYLVRSVLRPGWYEKTVTVNGDVSDGMLAVDAGGVSALVITVTNRPSRLTGVVRND